MLSEEFVGTDAFRVESLDQGFSIFGKGGSVNHDFEKFCHSLEEFLHPRSHQDKDTAYRAFYFDIQNDVWVFNLLEAGVHEGLVQVQNKSFLPNVFSTLGTQNDVAW